MTSNPAKRNNAGDPGGSLARGVLTSDPGSNPFKGRKEKPQTMVLSFLPLFLPKHCLTKSQADFANPLDYFSCDKLKLALLTFDSNLLY